MAYAGVNAPRQRRERGAPHMRAHSIKFTEQEWDDACRIAGEDDTTAGDVIRRALSEYVATRA